MLITASSTVIQIWLSKWWQNAERWHPYCSHIYSWSRGKSNFTIWTLWTKMFGFWNVDSTNCCAEHLRLHNCHIQYRLIYMLDGSIVTLTVDSNAHVARCHSRVRNKCNKLEIGWRNCSVYWDSGRISTCTKPKVASTRPKSTNRWQKTRQELSPGPIKLIHYRLTEVPLVFRCTRKWAGSRARSVAGCFQQTVLWSVTLKLCIGNLGNMHASTVARNSTLQKTCVFISG